MELYNAQSVLNNAGALSEQIKKLLGDIENSNLNSEENKKFVYLQKQLYSFKTQAQVSREKQEAQFNEFITNLLDNLYLLKNQADINNLLIQPTQSTNSDYCFYATMAKYSKIIENAEINNEINGFFIKSIKDDIDYVLKLDLSDSQKEVLSEAKEVINEIIEYLKQEYEEDSKEQNIKRHK